MSMGSSGNERTNKILLLGLGNDILGDDAIGLVASRLIHQRFYSQIDVVEAPVAGFALLDYLAGYERALILDSLVVVDGEQGSIRELKSNDFPSQSLLSPHYVGLKDVMDLAQRLNIDFPTYIRILVIGISDPFVLREGLTPELTSQLPRFILSAEAILRGWGCGPTDDLVEQDSLSPRSWTY